MLISTNDRIFIAGHRGMAGSAIARRLEAEGHRHLLRVGRSELDLMDGPAVAAWFADQRPDVVVLAAARVGASSPTPPIRPTSCSTTSRSSRT